MRSGAGSWRKGCESFIAPMPKPQLVAVDTNVLMRLAEGHDATVDAWQLINRRLRPVQFLVPPTVIGELASKVLEDSEPAIRRAARAALAQLRSRWRFQPVDFNAVQDAISIKAIQCLRESGVIPYEERNDAAIVVESAILNCILLVSRDSHLLNIDHERLTLLFRQFDLVAPIISSPEKLLKRFYV
jgi:predicted nucleic acid-binding protein